MKEKGLIATYVVHLFHEKRISKGMLKLFMRERERYVPIAALHFHVKLVWNNNIDLVHEGKNTPIQFQESYFQNQIFYAAQSYLKYYLLFLYIKTM